MDTTGTNQTAKIGFSGDAASGKVFIDIGASLDVMSISAQSKTINGKFSGDGSGLTGVTKPSDLGNYYDKSTVDSKLTNKMDAGASIDASKITGTIDTARMPANLKTLAVSGKLPPNLISGGANGQVLTNVSGTAGWANTPSAPVTSVVGGNGIIIPSTTGTVNVAANLTTSGGNNGAGTTVARGDHKHDIANITNLQSSLDGKANTVDLGISYAISTTECGDSITAVMPYPASAGSCSDALLTINAPIDGYVLVTGNACLMQNGTSTSWVRVGIEQNGNTDAAPTIIGLAPYPGASSTCTVSKLFQVTVGSHKYRVVFARFSAGHQGYRVLYSSVSAVFTKKGI